MRKLTKSVIFVLFAVVHSPHSAVLAQPDPPGEVIAITHVRVVDGTGAPSKDNQTIVITRGKIVALGNAADVAVPNGARALDLRGRTVMPRPGHAPRASRVWSWRR